MLPTLRLAAALAIAAAARFPRPGCLSFLSASRAVFKSAMSVVSTPRRRRTVETREVTGCDAEFSVLGELGAARCDVANATVDLIVKDLPNDSLWDRCGVS